MNVLQTIDLRKYYGSEPNVTRALDGDTADERFIDEIVEMLALEDRLMNMPNNLSGGQMRVAIARCLVEEGKREKEAEDHDMAF